MTVRKYLLNISQNYSFAILRPVQSAILNRNAEVAWFIQGSNVNQAYFHSDEKVLHSVEEVMAYSPDAVLYPANIAPTFFPGINVAVFHGFDAGKLDKRGNNDHYKVRNCFDLYCTQGPESTVQFSKLAESHQTFSVKETGWCALDPLFQAKPFVTENNIPTILMCSTFSKHLTCAPHLFETVKRLSKTGKWRWLIQFHPKMNKTIVEQYKAIQNDYLTFVETDDVIPLLQQADVMVCDTSSVLIMFLLQHKPVVTFNNIAPKDYMLDIGDPNLLEATITQALSRPKELMDNIQRFINDTHPYQDGKSSQRVLDAVDEMLAGKNIPARKKPLNLLRQFKMRKQLNYWKFW
ncbi:CDP-glycerol glycerophosphotransferase family protein [Thalassotalea sp. SU-HH00458]|uniref:CDP-glycerol glycerophosphotransferase family protein n=1 Tax=Thalassotalea sp. SU-HH00458 TaxID=3127657 RepID=UPI003103DBCC